MSAQRATAGLDDWVAGPVLRLLVVRWQSQSWIIGMIAFAGYWGVPLVVAALDGTLATRASLTRAIQGAAMPWTRHLLEVLRSHQAMDEGLAYLNDRSHLAFSVLLVPGTMAAVAILRRFKTAVMQLAGEGLLEADAESVYGRWRARATTPWTWIVAAVFGAWTVVLFLHFRSLPSNTLWWGHSSHGIAGLAFAIAAGLMVFFGTQSAAFIAVGAVMISKLLQRAAVLRPFHPDGCNGLAPVGKLILLLWILAVALAGEVGVTLYLGYLGIEQTELTWLLAILVLASIPVIALGPLIASLRAITRIRAKLLALLEPALGQLLEDTTNAAGRQDLDQALKTVGQLKQLREVHAILLEMNVWPFNRRALALAAGAYGIQVVLTLKQLLPLLRHTPG